MKLYVIVISFLFLLLSSFTLTVNSHLDHTPHYNSGSVRDGMGEYYAYMALEPEYARPNDLTQIIFSIQDYQNNDVRNIESMVEIYDSLSGERVGAFPWTKRNIGDFYHYFIFPKPGNYQIVLSVADKTGNVNHYSIDPPRKILNSINGCNCERSVFTVSITKNWGEIRNSLFALAILAPISVLGIVLYQNFKRNKQNSNTKRDDLIRYSIMLLALAGGMVHLAVFPEHGSVHLYYVIFLLVASCIQIGYGVFYVMLTISDTQRNENISEISDKKILYAKTYYKKSLALNLVGLVGTLILLGLYTYSVIFPPPLSPTNQPEEVGFAGILAKSVEFMLVVGVLYLMLWEKKRKDKVLTPEQTSTSNR